MADGLALGALESGKLLLRALWREYQADPGRVAGDRRRMLAREEALPELHRMIGEFVEGRADLQGFRDRMHVFALDHKHLWGFHGFGQMAINQLANTARPKDVDPIRRAVALPADLDDADVHIQVLVVLCHELKQLARDAGEGPSAPAPGHMPYVLSFLWEAFDRDRFPVYFPNSRETLEAFERFERTGDAAGDYRRFAEAMAAAREELGTGTWEVEHAFSWQRAHPFLGFVETDFASLQDTEALNTERWNNRVGYADAAAEDRAKRNTRRVLTRLRWLAEELQPQLASVLPDHPLRPCSERASVGGEGRYRSTLWLYAAREELGGAAAGAELRVQVDREGVAVMVRLGVPPHERLDDLDQATAMERRRLEESGFAEDTGQEDAVVLVRRWAAPDVVAAGRALMTDLLDALRAGAPLLQRWEELLSADTPPPPGTGPRAWLVRPRVEDRDRSDSWLREGYVALGWPDAQGIEPGMDRAEIRGLLAAGYPGDTAAQVRSAAGNHVRFLNEMAVGDLVVTPARTAIHVGRIRSDPSRIATGPEAYRRAVEWLASRPLDGAGLPGELLHALNRRHAVGDLTGLAREIERLLGDPTPDSPGTLDPKVMHLYVKLADLGHITAEETVTVHRAHAEQHGQVWFMGNISVTGRAAAFRDAIAEGQRPVLVLGRRGVGLVALAPIHDVRTEPEPVPCPDPHWLPDAYDPDQRYRTWIRAGRFALPDELPTPVRAEDFELLNFPGVRLSAILNKRPSHAYVRYDPAEVVIEDTPLPLPTPERFEEGYGRVAQELAVDREVVARIVTHLVAGKSVILTGPTGSGKTALAQLIPRAFFDIDAHVVTATADWTSYEVIGGIAPHVTAQEDGDGQLGYGIRRGHVYEAVLRNWQADDDGNLLETGGRPVRRVDQRDGRPTVGTWLVVDEFNRADIDKAFGDLFTAIEYRSLRVPALDPDHPGVATRELPIPRHFRIIATMNSVDRNYLYALSDALKRRFAFVDIGLPLDAEEERGKVRARVQGHLDELAVTVDTDELDDAVDVLYGLLAFVRVFHPVGVAQAIATLQYAALRSAFGGRSAVTHLDEALLADVVPQLENLPAFPLACLRAWTAGDARALARELHRLAGQDLLSLAELRDLAAVARHLASVTDGVPRERCEQVAQLASGSPDEDLGNRIQLAIAGSGDGAPALVDALAGALTLEPFAAVADRLAEYGAERGL